MDGTESDRSVKLRAFENVFEISNERNSHYDVSIFVSILESYYENLGVLVVTESGAKRVPNLEARTHATQESQNAGYAGAPKRGLCTMLNWGHAWKVFRNMGSYVTGIFLQKQGQTDKSQHHSRSHMIARGTVTSRRFDTGMKTCATLHLVSLVGWKHVTRSNAPNERLRDTQHVEKLLSRRGDAFPAITSTLAHEPYRNSKLTQLLQNSLDGDYTNLTFLSFSSGELESIETLNTLQISKRVSKA